MKNGNVVAELRDLLGADVLLLHCRRGTKKPAGRWKHLTVKAMEDPAYLTAEGWRFFRPRQEQLYLVGE